MEYVNPNLETAAAKDTDTDLVAEDLIEDVLHTMLDEGWVLSPAVALRPEPFAAMAYPLR